MSALDATAELHELLPEPLVVLFKLAGISNLVTIDAICRYHIPEMIPSGGQVSFADIAERTGLEKREIRHLLEYAMSMRIFRSPEPEMVAHTKISKFLTIPYIHAWVGFESKDTWPATTRIVDAIQKWPSSGEAGETGFALANGKSVFEVLVTDPPRAMRFASGIQAIDHVPGYAIGHASKAYDWAALGDAFIVSMGGSRGQAAIELAKSFGDVKFLVQDAAMTIKGAEADVPEQLKGRVEFMEHELFQPQTVQADVYFFRMALRTWDDQYAVQVLRAQIPVLRPGVKVLIQDVRMPEHDLIPLWRERMERSVDMSLECLTVANDILTNGRLYLQRPTNDSSFIGCMSKSKPRWRSWRFTGACPARQELETMTGNDWLSVSW